MNWQELLAAVSRGETKAIARALTLVENEFPGYETLLQSLPPGSPTAIIGITGPPGAGKSTLVDDLISTMIDNGKKVAVICVDPSSPFNLGALLGDRIRMSDWYNHPDVFIRSLASRGSLGGLHPKIIELTDLLKAAGFDYILVETVGVGQSEVEIAGLADLTAVVIVPEAGDEIQTMKAGLMEIADLFIVNKADRPGADAFVHHLRLMLAPAFQRKETEVEIIKTVASQKEGIAECWAAISRGLAIQRSSDKKYRLLADRAFHLIQQQRVRDIDRAALLERVRQQSTRPGFNLYQFIQGYLPGPR